jgi:esterase/lipase superfamily enzyme
MRDGERHTFEDLLNRLGTKYDLTEEQLQELLPAEKRERWDRTLRKTLTQALARLSELGLAYESGPGVYELYRFGLLVAAEKPVSLSPEHLRRFPEFVLWEYRKKYGNFPPPDAPPPPPTPAPSAPAVGVPLGIMEERDRNLLYDPRDVQVWFATNRAPNNSTNVRLGFSNRRDTTVRYGSCLVNIPEGHNTGETEPSVFQAWRSGTDGIIVRAIQPMPPSDFWRELEGTLASSVDNDSVLFFLHGFNVSFLEAAIRTAQLKYDLKIPHAAFYSWPSRRRLLGFGADSASIDAAVPGITDFLSRLGLLTAERKVKLHVIAHSMGNRGLLLAMDKILDNLKGSPKQFKLSEVVFAAPDVDQERFKQLAGSTTSLSRQRTLYAAHDLALISSRWIYRAPRAGLLPPVTVVNEIDTVDVTPVDLSLLGHGYVAECRPVIGDMFDAMHNGTVPRNRMGLRPKQSAYGPYWILH